MEDLAKQVKALKIYAAFLTAVVIAFLATALIFMHRPEHFKEITAERIDIVKPDGQLQMVISNHEKQHAGRMDGKDLESRDRPAGMIFFNEEGDECGGIVYDGDKRSASMTYSIDQYKNDQVMQLQYSQENSGQKPTRSYGLRLWDRADSFTLSRLIIYNDSLKKLHNPSAYHAGINKLKMAGLLGQERLFIGENNNGEVGLFLRDNKGIPRLKLYINQKNQPVIETLDENGTVLVSK